MALSQSLSSSSSNETTGLLRDVHNCKSFKGTTLPTSDPTKSIPAICGITRIETLNYTRRILYFSHFLEQFSDTAWDFAIILYLAAITDYQSLLLVSTYGIATNGTVFFLGSKVGKYIDKEMNRLRAVQILVCIENVSIIIGSVILYQLLLWKQDKGMLLDVLTDGYCILLLISLHIVGALSDVLDGGVTVAIERDWVVVLGEVAATVDRIMIERDETTISTAMTKITTKNTRNVWLTETNVTMKQIDLCCKIIAPAFAGIVVDLYGKNQLAMSAIAISSLVALSLIIEYILTVEIYRLVPELAVKKNTASGSATASATTTTPIVDKSITIDNNIKTYRCTGSCYEYLKSKQNHPLFVYFQQPVWYAGLALALL
jgi:solute carrier family 40 (iron-regulated transporter), member 1